ncbi:hypothetical protein BV22DRAFT_1133624 [Leucogyrophana mollusca]|uniref:Uncharacterized protein n=1 Tax=Leucogyrophana mollusca TaxID=85980 RepID=A0ACB8B4C9_9AGAM|nr:hypothetical protein BV22DRAFT_1133624 [Leucogyrophana mollusca]
MYLKTAFSIVVCFLVAALAHAKCSLSDNHSSDWVVDMYEATDCLPGSSAKSKAHHSGNLDPEYYCSGCYTLPSPLKSHVESIVYTANAGNYMAMWLYSSSNCTGWSLGEYHGSEIWNSTPSELYKTASFEVCLADKAGP